MGLREVAGGGGGALLGVGEMVPQRVVLGLRVLQQDEQGFFFLGPRMQLGGEVVVHHLGGVGHLLGGLLRGDRGRGRQMVDQCRDVPFELRRWTQRRFERLGRRVERSAEAVQLLPRGLGRRGKERSDRSGGLVGCVLAEVHSSRLGGGPTKQPWDRRTAQKPARFPQIGKKATDEFDGTATVM